MSNECIQAKHNQKTIKVKTKHTTTRLELVHSNVCAPFPTPTSPGLPHCILFIDNYTRYTSVRVHPDRMSKTFTSAHQPCQAGVNFRVYKVKRFRCNNGRGEYNNMTCRQVLTAHGTTYEPCSHYANRKIGVAERMIPTITEKARYMTLDSQVPHVFWGEAVNTAVYLHQRTRNEGITRRHHHIGYQAPYSTPYAMLHASGKPSHNNDSNTIPYKAPLQHLQQFGWYASVLIPKPQCHGIFSPKSNPCVIVHYMHNWTTFWRIWDQSFRVPRSQSDDIFDKRRNAHSSCLHGDETDIFDLAGEAETVEEIETGGDGLLSDDTGTSGTGEGHGIGHHDCTDDDTDHIRPHIHQSHPGRTGVRSRPPDEGDTAPLSRDPVVHKRHLSIQNDNAR
jgi:hypothetical protein